MNTCDPTKLDKLTGGKLEEHERREVESHLDHCLPCQERLLKSAGSSEEWQLATTVLKDLDTDLDNPLSIVTEHSPSHTWTNASETWGSARNRSSMIEVFLGMLGPSDHPQSAGRIGQFEILGIIGHGGMGVVVKAREPALDRIVAIKLLAPHLSSSRSARTRFEREARAAASVIHDNVIEIYQVGEWNGLPFLVMPYVTGPSLQDRIDDEAPLTLESILVLSTQIARGLAAAHNQGLVHRDVKPSNILISAGTERALITDFGLARTADDASLTRAGILAGTPSYMSPEQARGEEVDQQSDLFSLGSLIFTMACGHPPCEAESGSDAIQRIAQYKIQQLNDLKLDFPHWFCAFVDWLHQPKPKDRPASATEVAELLEKCLVHVRQPAVSELPAKLANTTRSKGGRIRAWATLATITLLATAGLGWSLAFGPSSSGKQSQARPSTKTTGFGKPDSGTDSGAFKNPSPSLQESSQTIATPEDLAQSTLPANSTTPFASEQARQPSSESGMPSWELPTEQIGEVNAQLRELENEISDDW